MNATQSMARCKVANTTADITVMNGAITAAAKMFVETGIVGMEENPRVNDRIVRECSFVVNQTLFPTPNDLCASDAYHLLDASLGTIAPTSAVHLLVHNRRRYVLQLISETQLPQFAVQYCTRTLYVVSDV